MNIQTKQPAGGLDSNTAGELSAHVKYSDADMAYAMATITAQWQEPDEYQPMAAIAHLTDEDEHEAEQDCRDYLHSERGCL